MIKTVSVINYLGEKLDLELRAPEKVGLYVKSVTGIGPGKANINTTDLASDDGGIYNSARAEIRNIVLTLGMMHVPGVTDSIESSRQLTYKYFPRKRPLTLIFETDNKTVYCDGYTESNEPDIFNQEETTQISVICPDPNFYEYNGEKSIYFANVYDEFEFPGVLYDANGHVIEEDPEYPYQMTTGYQNESDEDNTEFGYIETLLQQNIYYEGEVETGILINIHPSASLTGFVLYNYETGERITIDDDSIKNITGNAITANDEIFINTKKGSKSATLLRNGITYNIMNALGRNPVWFQLYKGDNIFAFEAETGLLETTVTMAYIPAYEGV